MHHVFPALAARRPSPLPLGIPPHPARPACPACRSFFGNFGFGGFGFGQQEEETPKGNNVLVELEVSLKHLYLGGHFKAGSREVGRSQLLFPHAAGSRRGVVAGLQTRPPKLRGQAGPGTLCTRRAEGSRASHTGLPGTRKCTPLCCPRPCSSSATRTWSSLRPARASATASKRW